MVKITSIYKPLKGHLEGEQTYLGDFLGMDINHLLAGMMLQIYMFFVSILSPSVHKTTKQKPQTTHRVFDKKTSLLCSWVYFRDVGKAGGHL